MNKLHYWMMDISDYSFESINRVYDINGLAPTINTCGGGQRQPMIVVGSTQKNAYIGDGSYCPTLTTAMGEGGGQIPMIIEEAWSCASRGRDPENPSDRTAGIHLEQRLEINHDGVCNCITSVAKDAYVLEKLERVDDMDNPKCLGNIYDS